MAKFINIDLTAYGVHVSSNIHVIGLPSMTGLDGFVHNLERHFGFVTRSWSFAYRQCDMTDGHLRIANCEVGSNNSRSPSTPSTILDKRTATVAGFLIIEIEDEPQSTLNEMLIQMEDGIESLRFCGGTLMVMPNSGIKVWGDIHQALGSIRRLNRRPHFFMEDQEALLNDVPDGLGKLDWLMDLIARPKQYDKAVDQVAYEGDYKGFLTPVIKGYALLENPRERAPVRCDYAHAYAEPVLSVVRMRTLLSVIAELNAEQQTPPVFWLNEMKTEGATPHWDITSYQIAL